MGLDKAEYCCIADCNDYGDKAHLITRATLPQKLWDDPHYYLYLCRRHHTEQHLLGIDTFCHKHGLCAELFNARQEYAQYNTSKD